MGCASSSVVLLQSPRPPWQVHAYALAARAHERREKLGHKQDRNACLSRIAVEAVTWMQPPAKGIVFSFTQVGFDVGCLVGCKRPFLRVLVAYNLELVLE